MYYILPSYVTVWEALSIALNLVSFFCGALLVFIWAARTACGVRDSRQTMSLTEQLVFLAKSFPSLRASCLEK